MGKEFAKGERGKRRGRLQTLFFLVHILHTPTLHGKQLHALPHEKKTLQKTKRKKCQIITGLSDWSVTPTVNQTRSFYDFPLDGATPTRKGREITANKYSLDITVFPTNNKPPCASETAGQRVTLFFCVLSLCLSARCVQKRLQEEGTQKKNNDENLGNLRSGFAVFCLPGEITGKR